MEHHANIVPWQQLADRTGATIRWLPITDDGYLALDQLETILTPRTKLLAVTAISNVLGTINPIKEIALQAHKANVPILVDAAQSVPHAAIDVHHWDADFVAFGGHKMLGPTGIGVLYGRRSLLEAMPPYSGGGAMIRRVRKEGFEPADLPEKFEAGTPPFVEAVGLAAAIEYLQRVGLPAIAEYERKLAAQAIEALSAIEGVHIFGPPVDDRAGIVSFQIDGVHAHDVAQILDRYGIAVRAGHHCAMPLHLRLGAPGDRTCKLLLLQYGRGSGCPLRRDQRDPKGLPHPITAKFTLFPRASIMPQIHVQCSHHLTPAEAAQRLRQFGDKLKTKARR